MKRGRLPDPVLLGPADFDLAELRMLDFVPGHGPFGQEQILVELPQILGLAEKAPVALAVEQIRRA